MWSWYHNTHTDQWNRIENTEINSDSYSQLISDKGGKNIKWEKDSFQQVMLGKLDSHMQIHKLAHTLTPCTRINSKWFKDLNIRHHQIPGREVRQNILWQQPYKCFLGSVSQGNRNKSKNKPMGPNLTDKLLHSKGSHKKTKQKTTYRMRENTFK